MRMETAVALADFITCFKKVHFIVVKQLLFIYSSHTTLIRVVVWKRCHFISRGITTEVEHFHKNMNM